MLDPLNVEAIERAGLVWHYKGDPANAQAAFTHALQLQPNYQAAQYNMGLSFFLKGDKAKAKEMFDKLRTDWWKYGNALLQMKVVSAVEADAALAAYIKDHPTGNYEIAILFALRGKPDKAFESLQRAYETRLISQTVKFQPLLSSLHSDPRFNALLKKWGLGNCKLHDLPEFIQNNVTRNRSRRQVGQDHHSGRTRTAPLPTWLYDCGVQCL